MRNAKSRSTNSATLLSDSSPTLRSLGYDADRAWEPNSDELESWQSTSVEYRAIAKTIHEYVAEVTLRIRRVELSPFLIETSAGELGWQPIGIDDHEVQGILREYPAQSQMEISRGDASTRVRRGQEGEIIAERSLSRTRADLAAQLAATGLPTSDLGRVGVRLRGRRTQPCFGGAITSLATATRRMSVLPNPFGGDNGFCPQVSWSARRICFGLGLPVASRMRSVC